MNSTEPKGQNIAAESAELLAIVSRKEAKAKGLKYYFTGNQCKRGHTSKRRVGNSGCCDCIKLMESSVHRMKSKVNYRKEYRSKNKVILSAKDKSYASKNKEKIKQQKALYRVKNSADIKNKKSIYHLKNKDELNKISREYASNNKAKRNVAMKVYLKNPDAKSAAMCRAMLHRILKLSSRSKNSKTEIALGYSSAEFKSHIESLWIDGMSWRNHSISGWHVDHIKPVAVFLREGITDPKIINKLSNLQPLWSEDNMSKKDKY